MTPVTRFRRIFWICAAAALIATAAVLWRGAGSPEFAKIEKDALVDILMVLIGIGAVFFYLWMVVEYRILRPLQGLEEDLRAVLRNSEDRPIDHRTDTLIEPVARAVDKLARRRADNRPQNQPKNG